MKKTRMLRFALGGFLACISLMGCAKSTMSSNATNVGANLIQVQLTADRDCVKAGDIVNLRATATNVGKARLVIELVDRPALDIAVAYSLHTKSITPDTFEYWSDRNESGASAKRLELEPGESKRIEMDWVAKPAYGTFAQIALKAILRYGENASEKLVAQDYISVDTCP